MTKKEFADRVKAEEISLREYDIVIGSVTDRPYVIGCYCEDGVWKIYETRERSGHYIIDEVEEENIAFDELYELVKLQESYIRNSMKTSTENGARHGGSFNNADYFDAIDAIKANDWNQLNKIMERSQLEPFTSLEFKKINRKYNDFIERAKAEFSHVDATYGLMGKAGPWVIDGAVQMPGGAGQIVTPFNGYELKRMGLIKQEY